METKFGINYIVKLVESSIDGSVLEDLTENDLEEELGVT